MDSLSQSYEKYVKEIQYLKKQISAEKNAHQNSLKQLQSTYQIIDQLKEMLRHEQGINLKLKAQVADKSHKITTISHQYEEQITNVKDMISVKDEELRRLSSALLVNDADLIRLKVVNQLSLSHKEEIQGFQKEINRKNTELTQSKTRNKLLEDKNEFLNNEMKKLQQQTQYKQQQLNLKYMGEVRDLYQTVQHSKRQTDKWYKKYDLLQKKVKKQSENYRDQINKLNKQLQIQNRAMLANGSSKSQKVKIDKLEEQIMKIQDELNQERDIGRKLENQISTFKRQNKVLKQSQAELKNDKERLEDQINELKREMGNKQSQKSRQIDQIRRQYENAGREDTSRGHRQKISLLQAQNKKFQLTIDSLKQEIIVLKQQKKEGGSLNSIRQQLNNKNEQIQKLILQIQGHKKRQRTKSDFKGKQDSQLLRAKLSEANAKIVSLLKQKVQMQREIQRDKN